MTEKKQRPKTCRDCWFARHGGQMAHLPESKRACDVKGGIVNSNDKACKRFMSLKEGLRRARRSK